MPAYNSEQHSTRVFIEREFIDYTKMLQAMLHYDGVTEQDSHHAKAILTIIELTAHVIGQATISDNTQHRMIEVVLPTALMDYSMVLSGQCMQGYIPQSFIQSMPDISGQFSDKPKIIQEFEDFMDDQTDESDFNDNPKLSGIREWLQTKLKINLNHDEDHDLN